MSKPWQAAEILSADEAAVLLNVTPRRVLDYVRAGLLWADPRFRETVLCRQQVERFEKPRGKPGPKPKNSMLPPAG